MIANFMTYMAKRIAVLAAGFVVSLGLVFVSVANAVTYNVTAQAGGLTGTGTFTIADSLIAPNAVILFQDFTDFSFSIGSDTFALGDNIDPTSEGVITDATGTVTQFADTDGDWVQFFPDFYILFAFREGDLREFQYWTSQSTFVTGTYNIDPIPTPLPPALLLFGAALAGMAGFNRLKRRGVSGQV